MADVNYQEQYFSSDDAFFITFEGDKVNNDKRTGDSDDPLPADLNTYLIIKNKDGELRTQINHVAFGDAKNKVRTSEINIDGVRGICLRAPMMIGGWGFDVDGAHVLGDNAEDIIAGKLDLTKWKYGPLDLRWDNDKELWVAGGGASVKFLEFIDGEEAE